MSQFNIDTFLEYVWVPIILPFIILLLKSFLRVKEIRKSTSADIEEFISLYNSRIKDNLRICAEEIVQFINKREGEAVEHHLYVCKKLNKTVGFIKFMFSEQYKYIFIAYVATDKDDSIARQYALKLMIKRIYRKYIKKKLATRILTEIERGTNNNYNTALARLISRYAKRFKKECYIFDFDYMQPSMPDDNSGDVSEEILSLAYIPIYSLANNRMSKVDLLNLLQSIYFEIYYPSCNDVTTCDCNNYNTYLENIMDLYKSSLPDYINLIKM